MKMVKSLLLGSAAGLMAVTAGQAADLPVKAKPVEYVKVCSLYGAGFYYMPGTDMCIKIGGWTRAEATYGQMNSNMTWGPFSGYELNRNYGNMVVRARGYITADAREQTAYGTARAYIDVGINTNDIGLNGASNTFSSNRAFLQWAGFTAGLTQSFFDFYSGPATSYRAAYNVNYEDTGDGGWWLWAYTAQLGNGLSATLSAEERRSSQTIDQSTTTGINAGGTGGTAGTIGTGTVTMNGYGGWQAPDIVGNVRVDQTWGSAQVMAAAHEVNPLYYGTTAGTGHPSDQWGFVVGAGLKLNFPMIAQGDYFQGEVNYTQGAVKYLNNNQTSNFILGNGSNQAFGIQSDCVYGGTGAAGAANQTGCNLTTAWGVSAAFEHYWTPQWHQSIVGSYEAMSYNNQANAILCTLGGFGAGVGSSAAATAGCNMNWSAYSVGSRLQWDVTKSFYLGVEVMYDNVNSASTPTGTLGNFGIGGANAPVWASNEHAWTGTIRMHKDFLP